MKNWMFFFVTFTVLQLFFTVFYVLLERRIDLTILLGTTIYVFVMLRGYIAYKYSRSREEKNDLLDSLPS